MEHGTLHELAIETTRRCNLQCKHCMRGPSQNIDMDKKYIDLFFEKNKFGAIETLLFSGGEPTLNPDLIVYTIDKIIKENINVWNVAMVTNGQIYHPEIVEAFNRFNEYRNNRFISERNIDINNINDKDLSLVNANLDRHVRITFSTDPYHSPVKDDVRKAYMEDSRGLLITDYAIPEDKVYKTGFATFGEDYDYGLNKFLCWNGGYLCTLYLTATGYVTITPNGSYEDMDRINCGRVEDFSMDDTILKYGQKIEFNSEGTSKKR